MNRSLPVPNPCLSFWQRTTRAFPFLNQNCDAPVPSTVKYLIIGSGIAGLLSAYKLIEGGVKGEDILILEAREAISGASGRNAGHIRPDAFRGFPTFSALHGPTQAKKILENEALVLETAAAFINDNAIDCDFNLTTTLDVCLSPAFADEAARSLSAYAAAGGDVSGVTHHAGPSARARSRLPGAVCAYGWRAASNHPGKLCQWILSSVLEKGAGLWTHCAATSITAHDGSGNARWDVSTPRGVVAAGTVLHCTNAYAAHLVPGLARFVSPLLSQVHAFVPPASLAGANGVRDTLSVRYGMRHFFSVHQRLRDGTVVVGGTGTRGDDDLGAEETAGLVTFDDTEYVGRLAENSAREFAGMAGGTEGEAAPALRHGEGLDHAWTGILGMTGDSVPLVGPIEGCDGQWICAGFNGHGMARMFTCAPGLVKLVLGGTWEDTGLPECFQFSWERINKFVEQ